MTECSGANCLLLELVNPEPQTIAFYALILALLFYARGRSGRSDDGYDDTEYEAFTKEVEPIDDEDDLPAPVLAQDEDDDDLELLEELEDL